MGTAELVKRYSYTKLSTLTAHFTYVRAEITTIFNSYKQCKECSATRFSVEINSQNVLNFKFYLNTSTCEALLMF